MLCINIMIYIYIYVCIPALRRQAQTENVEETRPIELGIQLSFNAIELRIP